MLPGLIFEKNEHACVCIAFSIECIRGMVDDEKRYGIGARDPHHSGLGARAGAFLSVLQILFLAYIFPSVYRLTSFCMHIGWDGLLNRKPKRRRLFCPNFLPWLKVTTHKCHVS